MFFETKSTYYIWLVTSWCISFLHCFIGFTDCGKSLQQTILISFMDFFCQSLILESPQRACLHAQTHVAISIPGSFIQRIKSLQKHGPQGCSAHWPLSPDVVGLIANDSTSLDTDGGLPMALSRTKTIRPITVPPLRVKFPMENKTTSGITPALPPWPEP